jgi:hypothetical protein
LTAYGIRRTVDLLVALVANTELLTQFEAEAAVGTGNDDDLERHGVAGVGVAVTW